MNLGLKKLKQGGRFAIINQFNYNEKFKKSIEYFKQNTEVECAFILGNELFKPFANVKTLLIFGVKGKSKEKKCEIMIFDNEKIIVNKRSKFVDVKLLKPINKQISIKDFWDKISSVEFENIGHATIQDFKRAVIDFMSFESGLPREFIENPEKLGKALNYIRNKSNEFRKHN